MEGRGWQGRRQGEHGADRGGHAQDGRHLWRGSRHGGGRPERAHRGAKGRGQVDSPTSLRRSCFRLFSPFVVLTRCRGSLTGQLRPSGPSNQSGRLCEDAVNRRKRRRRIPYHTPTPTKYTLIESRIYLPFTSRPVIGGLVCIERIAWRKHRQNTAKHCWHCMTLSLMVSYARAARGERWPSSSKGYPRLTPSNAKHGRLGRLGCFGSLDRVVMKTWVLR